MDTQQKAGQESAGLFVPVKETHSKAKFFCPLLSSRGLKVRNLREKRKLGTDALGQGMA